jgi:hypothetical protein
MIIEVDNQQQCWPIITYKSCKPAKPWIQVSETKMDETRSKSFRPYNIIVVAQFGNEVGRNISSCESPNLGFLRVFLLEGNFQLLEITS